MSVFNQVLIDLVFVGGPIALLIWLSIKAEG